MNIADIPLLLPAAGKSSRLGSPKGLQTHARRTWLEIQCQAFHDAGGKAVALVLGYDRERYLAALRVPPTAIPDSTSLGGCTVRLLHNRNPERGSFSSLKHACRWLLQETNHAAAFLLPLDTPLPSPHVLEAMLAASNPGTDVVQPRYQECGGHPVLLSRNFLSTLMAIDDLDPAARLDVQIRRSRESGAVAAVNVTDYRVLLNLNDADAWQRYFAESSAPGKPTQRL